MVRQRGKSHAAFATAEIQQEGASRLLPRRRAGEIRERNSVALRQLPHHREGPGRRADQGGAGACAQVAAVKRADVDVAVAWYGGASDYHRTPEAPPDERHRKGPRAAAAPKTAAALAKVGVVVGRFLPVHAGHL